MLLREFMNLSQRPKEGFRRHFISDYFKLWVWYHHDKTTIEGFQLLYGGQLNEKAITWMKKGTFSHKEVSDEGLDALKSAQVLKRNAGKIRPSPDFSHL